MPLFVEDPAHFSKSRLKSDLIAHNVALPPSRSRKEVYVELHMKHVDQKRAAADFSSDDDEEEEEEEKRQDEPEEDPDNTEMPDPSGLTDDDLKAALLVHGVKAGPIVASTRALYENKLRKLLQSDGHHKLNGAEEDVLYSDSEEQEEENGEDDDDEESDSEGTKEETVEQSEQAQQGSSQKGDYVYPQCFLPSSRLRARASQHREPSPKWNSGNALKSSERGRSRCSQIRAGISRASSVDQRSGLGSGMEGRTSLSSSVDSNRTLDGCSVSNRLDTPVDKNAKKNQSLYYTPNASVKLPQEPVKVTFKDLFPDTETTPTGIHATRRKPIKGAAGRPVQYAYPDSPASPTALERRDMERRLVPIHIQLTVFVILAILLYLIYVWVEDHSFNPFVALQQSLGQGSDNEGGL